MNEARCPCCANQSSRTFFHTKNMLQSRKRRDISLSKQRYNLPLAVTASDRRTQTITDGAVPRTVTIPTSLLYCASSTQRNPSPPDRSLLGAIIKSLPCS